MSDVIIVTLFRSD